MRFSMQRVSVWYAVGCAGLSIHAPNGALSNTRRTAMPYQYAEIPVKAEYIAKTIGGETDV